MFLRNKHSTPRSSGDLGRQGERLAGRHLKRNGYRVVARNVRTLLGELDLIALSPDRETLVFVEVKTRAMRPQTPSPPPEAAITAKKQRKLLTLAQQYAHRHGLEHQPLRIDVIAVDWPDAGKPVIRHHTNAVTG